MALSQLASGAALFVAALTCAACVSEDAELEAAGRQDQASASAEPPMAESMSGREQPAIADADTPSEHADAAADAYAATVVCLELSMCNLEGRRQATVCMLQHPYDGKGIFDTCLRDAEGRTYRTIVGGGTTFNDPSWRSDRHSLPENRLSEDDAACAELVLPSNGAAPCEPYGEDNHRGTR